MSFSTSCALLALLALFGLVCLLAGGIKSVRLALAYEPTLCTPQGFINILVKRVLFWSLLCLFGWACISAALVAFLVHCL